MGEAQAQTVMRRKAGGKRAQAESASVTPERSLTIALSKTAQDQLQMPLRVAEITESRMSLSDLPEVLEALSLLAIMEGPAETLGLIALPPATLSALIEVQTMGRVSPNVPAPRKPTRIDAAMAAEFLDSVMQGFEDLLATHPDITWAGGFRYASFLDDPRPLGLLLEDVSFRVFRLTLQIGAGGEREGGLLLALPAQGKGRGPRKSGEALPEAGSEAARAAETAGVVADLEAQALWQEQLEQTVMGARVDLTGVLHRVTLSLAQVTQLKVGVMIPVPYVALEDLRIEAIGRRKIAAARLGQSHGMRALRVRLGEESELEGDETGAASAGSSGYGSGGYGVRTSSEAGGMSGEFAASSAGFEAQEPLGEFPAMGDLPALGGLPPLGDFPAMGDLPPLGDFPALGELPAMDELPPLKIGGL